MKLHAATIKIIRQNGETETIHIRPEQLQMDWNSIFPPMLPGDIGYPLIDNYRTTLTITADLRK